MWLAEAVAKQAKLPDARYPKYMAMWIPEQKEVAAGSTQQSVQALRTVSNKPVEVDIDAGGPPGLNWEAGVHDPKNEDKSEEIVLLFPLRDEVVAGQRVLVVLGNEEQGINIRTAGKVQVGNQVLPVTQVVFGVESNNPVLYVHTGK
jgi:hypothetical protein